MARGRWTRVVVDSGRCFVYGPMLGRLYLLRANETTDRAFQRLLGLTYFEFCDSLPDPAECVLHSLSTLNDNSIVPPASLRIAYRFLHSSRRMIPFWLMSAVLTRIARWKATVSPLTVSEIGQLVHRIETAAGFGDCYPRALLTAYLCLRSRQNCELVIGALSPTRLMHAWCAVNGQLPYEASPEHYMYQPLFVLSLQP